MNQAHSKLKARSSVVLALLHTVARTATTFTSATATAADASIDSNVAGGGGGGGGGGSDSARQQQQQKEGSTVISLALKDRLTKLTKLKRGRGREYDEIVLQVLK